jgi:putative transposase
MVTAATYLKAHHFNARSRLDLLHDTLLTRAQEYGWQLRAWAVFSNQYHFVSLSPPDPANLPRFIGHLHAGTSDEMNQLDRAPGRKVWFQYWDTHLTYRNSYFARLRYVHENPVRHGLVRVATAYPWRSAAWFEQTARRSFCQAIASFKIDRVTVRDEFEPCLPIEGL